MSLVCWERWGEIEKKQTPTGENAEEAETTTGLLEFQSQNLGKR